MKALVNFLCPYCMEDIKRQFDFSSAAIIDEIIYCDQEDGGCGRKMVVEVKATAVLTAKKIEGEMEK